MATTKRKSSILDAGHLLYRRNNNDIVTWVFTKKFRNSKGSGSSAGAAYVMEVKKAIYSVKKGTHEEEDTCVSGIYCQELEYLFNKGLNFVPFPIGILGETRGVFAEYQQDSRIVYVEKRFCKASHILPRALLGISMSVSSRCGWPAQRWTCDCMSE